MDPDLLDAFILHHSDDHKTAGGLQTLLAQSEKHTETIEIGPDDLDLDFGRLRKLGKVFVVWSTTSAAFEPLRQAAKLAAQLGRYVPIWQDDDCAAQLPRLLQSTEAITLRQKNGLTCLLAALSAPIQPPTFRIFLSHSTHDDSFVAEMGNFLATLLDCDVFNDVCSIEAGERFWPAIDVGIRGCEKMVVIVSRDSIESEWVRKEIELARQLGKKIIPVRIDNCTTDLFDERDLTDFRPNQIDDTDIDIGKIPQTHTKKLYGRGAEMQRLFQYWDDNKIRVVAFDAWGGMGKTSMLFHFLQELQRLDWRGAESVFAWSFYSQGSDEDRQTHSQDFFEAAFAHFGFTGEIPSDPAKQGRALANLIKQRRVLLVLDGLEPLQYAAGSSNQYGGIKDPGILELLRLLVTGGKGLTLISTRIQLHELESYSGFQREHLDRLPTDAAIELLRHIGVESHTYAIESGAELPPAVHAEFVDMIDQLQGHALSITLAGLSLITHHGSQIRAFQDFSFATDAGEDEDDLLPDAHRNAFRVIRSVELALVREMQREKNPYQSTAARQLAILYFLGLFDRPPSVRLLEIVFPPGDETDPFGGEDDPAVFAKSAEFFFGNKHSPGLKTPPTRLLFEALNFADIKKIRFALSQLAKTGLVSKVDENQDWHTVQLDSHPLIREYFGNRLRKLDVETFKEAHGRLYDCYRFAGLPAEFVIRWLMGCWHINAAILTAL